MSASSPSADQEMTESAPAEPATLTRWRDQIGRWLDDTTSPNAEQRADILPATDEAVSNCVEHAYPHQDHPGTITVHLRPVQFC